VRLHYYPETDSLYIGLSERHSADSREVASGVVLDFDAEGRLVGIDTGLLLHADLKPSRADPHFVLVYDDNCRSFLQQRDYAKL